MFQTKQGRPRACVYYEGEHKSGDCEKVTNVKERKEILAKKRLCFNCAAGVHRAASCMSKSTCKKCDKRHHTSICGHSVHEESSTTKKVLTASGNDNEGIFPVVVVKVNGFVSVFILAYSPLPNTT